MDHTHPQPHPYYQHRQQPLFHHHHQQHGANHAVSYAGSQGLTAPPPMPPPPLPPFSFAAMASEPTNQVTVDPLVFVHDDLIHFALSAHAAQLWPPHESEEFVAMFQPAPEPAPTPTPPQPPVVTMDEPPIKQEPPHSPLRIDVPVAGDQPSLPRRSARIAAAPRRTVFDHPMTPTTPGSTVGRASSVGLTSEDDEDSDDDDDDDYRGRRRRSVGRGGPGNKQVPARRQPHVAMEPGDSSDEDEREETRTCPDSVIIDKKERRRQQVREASSRRRVKLKEEGVFLTTRLRELEEDMRTLNMHFPHLSKLAAEPEHEDRSPHN